MSRFQSQLKFETPPSKKSLSYEDIARNVIMLDEKKMRIPDHLLHLLLDTCTKSIVTYDGAVKAFFAKDIAHSNEILEQRVTVETMNQQIATSLSTV